MDRRPMRSSLFSLRGDHFWQILGSMHAVVREITDDRDNVTSGNGERLRNKRRLLQVSDADPAEASTAFQSRRMSWQRTRSSWASRGSMTDKQDRKGFRIGSEQFAMT